MKFFLQKRGYLILVLNYIGRAIAALNTFWLLPTFLSLSQVGLYGGIHHLSFFLARLNLSQSIVRYGAPLRQDQRRKSAFLLWIALVNTLFYLLVLLAFYLLKPLLIPFFSLKTRALTDYIPLILLLGYVVLLNVMLKAWSIALNRVGWSSFFQHVVHNLLFVALIVSYGRGWITFRTLLVGTSIPYVVNLGLLLFELAVRGELRLCWDRRIFNRRFLRDFIQYSLFTLLSNSMVMVMIRLDNVMIFSMCGKRAEGLYYTISFLVLILEIPMKVIKQTRSSELVDCFARKDAQGLRTLYQETTRWQFVWTGICFLLLCSCLEWVLHAFPSEALREMKRLFFCLGLAKLVDSLFRMGGEVLLFSPYFRWATLSTLWVFLGIFGNYYLIHLMGIQGAPIATVAMLVLGGLFNVCIVWWRMRIHPFSWALLRWILAFGLVTGVLVLLGLGRG